MKQKANNFQQMRELGFYQQAAIAATLLERMLPNYQLFSEVTAFGDTAQLRNSLDLIWEWLAVKKARIDFAKLADELELVTPDVSQFDMFGVYPAVDCAIALDSFFNGILQQDATEFINVAKISQATVARLIEHESAEQDITSENELKKIVREHPLMQYEMECLAELIELVKTVSQFDSQQVKQLKAWVTEQGMTNIGLELN